MRLGGWVYMIEVCTYPANICINYVKVVHGNRGNVSIRKFCLLERAVNYKYNPPDPSSDTTPTNFLPFSPACDPYSWIQMCIECL